MTSKQKIITLLKNIFYNNSKFTNNHKKVDVIVKSILLLQQAVLMTQAKYPDVGYFLNNTVR